MNGYNKAFAIVLALVLLFALFTPVLAITGEVRALRDTNILKTASATGEVIGSLSEGSTVEMVGTSGDYTLIRYDGKVGYVLSTDIATFITINNDGTVGDSTQTSTNVQASTNADVTISALRQYMAKAGVNVRSGPGTNYSKLGTLKKGAYIDGATTPVGNWINVIYNGRSGYVSASYLTATGVAYDSDISSNPEKQKSVVYTIRPVELTSRAGGDTVVGSLLMGTRCQRLDIKNQYSKITCNGKTGYVLTRDLVVVNGTGAYVFSSLNKWRYAAQRNVTAYFVPVDSSAAYQIGYFNKDEAVWALSGNAYWTEVFVNGRVGYVRTADLHSSPSSSSRAVTSTGPYAIGKVLTVIASRGTPTYSTFALFDAYYPVYEDEPYGFLSKGTRVIVMRCTDKYAQVLWDDNRENHIVVGIPFAVNLQSAYVPISAVG